MREIFSVASTKEPEEWRRADGNDGPHHEKHDLSIDATVTVAAEVYAPGIQFNREAKELEGIVHLLRQLHLVGVRYTGLRFAGKGWGGGCGARVRSLTACT